jgi:uncharacterized protein
MNTRMRRAAAIVGTCLAVLASTLVVALPIGPAGANGGPSPLPLPTDGVVRPAGYPSAPSPGFGDVPASSYFVQGVAWLKAKDITGGFGGVGKFSPDALVTRRQMALFIWRMMDRPEGTTDCGFTDVPTDLSVEVNLQFATAACFLKVNGITTGYNNDPTTYAPELAVTRGQMAAFLWRLADKPATTESCGYVDSSSNADFRRGACWLKTWGITTGYGGDATRYAPDIQVTRAQMAAFLFRLASTGDAWRDGAVVRGSVEQLSVEGKPGTVVSVYDGEDALVDTAQLDVDGGKLWRKVPPGTYRVVYAGTDDNYEVRVTVTEEDLQGAEVPHPSGPLFTGQTLKPGYNYLTTRDGTRLGAMVTFPSGPGPYPTLVEYSGYDLSNPFDPTSGSSPYRLLAPQFGYAVVQVQMRGSGCSGGAFDYFEPMQSLDGYDAIETVAAQSWVKNKRVGTVGISYPGISQLFIAQTQAPSLAAITPVSVIGDTARAVLFPGGIYNNGFALSWASGRVNEAKPARPGAPNRPWTGGQTWVGRKITALNESGAALAGYVPDDTCRLNQRLHGQAADLINRIENSANETPEDYYLSPMRFVDKIKAPTLMVGAWQDEQTGGYWPNMLHRFDSNTFVRMIAQNGTHIEPIMPDNLKAAFEHLAFFVKGERPNFNTAQLNLLIGLAAGQLIGNKPLPPEGQLVFTASEYDSTTRYPTYSAARAAYLAAPRAIIRLENGAGPTGQAGGSLVPSESINFERWPLSDEETDTQTWYLHGDGTLKPTVSSVSDGNPGSSVSYTYDPANGSRTNWTSAAGCSEWLPEPTGTSGASCYNWAQPSAANEAVFITDAFANATLLAGTGLANLWLTWNPTGTPNNNDTDLEVTISEVRPDGKEVYVQTGWARTSFCVADPTYSRDGVPYATGTAEDAEACALTPGVAQQVDVPVFPFAHIFRAGSKLKVSVDAPGGSRVLWKFESRQDPATHTIHTSQSKPSSIELTKVVSRLVDSASPTGLAPTVNRWQRQNWTSPVLANRPSCTILRAQPCRDYRAPVLIPSPD